MTKKISHMFLMETIISILILNRIISHRIREASSRNTRRQTASFFARSLQMPRDLYVRVLGDDVSEERVNVITAAYSLVGEVRAISGAVSPLRSARTQAGEMQRRFQQQEVQVPEQPEHMGWTAAVLLPGQ